jgi:hypothetical protein
MESKQAQAGINFRINPLYALLSGIVLVGFFLYAQSENKTIEPKSAKISNSKNAVNNTTSVNQEIVNFAKRVMKPEFVPTVEKIEKGSFLKIKNYPQYTKIQKKLMFQEEK